MMKKDSQLDIPNQNSVREFFICAAIGFRRQLNVYATIIKQEEPIPFLIVLRTRYLRDVSYGTDAELIQKDRDALKMIIEEQEREPKMNSKEGNDKYLNSLREQLARLESKTKLSLTERKTMSDRLLFEKIDAGIIARNFVVHPLKTLNYISQLPLFGLLSLSHRIPQAIMAPLMSIGLVLLAPLTVFNFVYNIAVFASRANEQRHENFANSQSVQTSVKATTSDNEKIGAQSQQKDSSTLKNTKPGAEARENMTVARSHANEDGPLNRQTPYAPPLATTRFKPPPQTASLATKVDEQGVNAEPSSPSSSSSSPRT